MVAEALKQAGLKITLPRLRVLELLLQRRQDGAQHHMSAEDIYHELNREGNGVGLATVYRVLGQFADAGLVRRHQFEEGQSVFELSEYGPHDHLICLECGHIVEFRDDIIDERQRAVACRHGFALERRSQILYARCTQNPCPYRCEAS